MEALRKSLRVITAVVGYALLATVAFVTSALYHVTLPEARASAARMLEEVFADEFRGQLVVGSFESIRARRVVATDLKLIDPRGRTVITAKRVELVPDLQSFLSGSPRIKSAHLTDGDVTLIENIDGLPSFITSFEADEPSTGPPSLNPLVVRIEGITLQRVNVHGTLLGLQGIRAPNLAARGSIRVGGHVLVRVDNGTTTVDRPFPFLGNVESITGTISTERDEGVSLRIHGSRAATRASMPAGATEVVHATIRYAAKDKFETSAQTLHIEVDGQNVSTQTVQEIGFEWMPELAVPVVNGRFAMHGPVDDFKLDAQLTSSAGAVNVQGRISTVEGYSVDLATDRVEVSRVIDGGPDVVVQGRARLEATPLESAPRLRVSVAPFALGSFTVPAFSLNGAIEPDRLSIKSLEATHEGAAFSGQGHVGLAGDVALDIDAVVDDIAEDPALGRFVPGAHGRLHIEVHVATPDARRGRLDLSGHADLTNFRYNMLKASRLEIAGTAQGDPERPELRVTVRGRAIQVGEYALGDADMRVTGGPRNYKADGKIVRAGERNFVLAATAKVEDGAFTLDADPIELRVGEGTWRGALKGLRFASDREISLELLRFANRAQRLEARGKILAHGEDEASVLLQNFDLAAVTALIGETLPISEGNADAQVTLAGDLSRPLVQFQGALRQGVVSGVRDVNAVYFVVYENGTVNLDAEVDLGERGLVQARGSGAIDLKHSDPVQALLLARYALSIGSQGLTLDLVPQLREAGVLGKLSGELRVEGTLDSPELHGSIELNPIELPRNFRRFKR